MTRQDTTRQSRTSRARRAFGLFVVLWLNVALQPCAMAMGGQDDHDCPHCPPVAVEEHHGHHAADEAGSAERAPCATLADDCALDDDFNVDGRGTAAKFDAPDDEAPAVAASFEALAPTAPRVLKNLPGPTRSPPPGQGPPLNVLYCVYLD